MYKENETVKRRSKQTNKRGRVRRKRKIKRKEEKNGKERWEKKVV